MQTDRFPPLYFKAQHGRRGSHSAFWRDHRLDCTAVDTEEFPSRVHAHGFFFTVKLCVDFHRADVIVSAFEGDFTFAAAHRLGALEAEALGVADASGVVVGAVFLLLQWWAAGHLGCDAHFHHGASIALHAHADALFGHHVFHHLALSGRHRGHLLLRFSHLFGYLRIAVRIHFAADLPQTRFGGLGMGGKAEKATDGGQAQLFESDHGDSQKLKVSHCRQVICFCQERIERYGTASVMKSRYDSTFTHRHHSRRPSGHWP